MGRTGRLFLLALALAAGAGAARAHGGQYSCGRTVVPPSPGKAPARQRGPTTPSVPSVPRGAVPGKGVPKGRSPVRGRVVFPDLVFTDWSLWWEFNKDPYLDLKAEVAKPGRPRPGLLVGLRCKGQTNLLPSRKTLEEVVIPALKKALRETRQRDMICSCLVALAKIGGVEGLDRIFRSRLTDGDQKISETALLCFGIAGLKESVPDLVEILKDTPRGRKLLGRSGKVPFRKRAFAAYALGLVAGAHKDNDLKRKVLAAAGEILDQRDRGYTNPDLPVSAVLAIRLLAPDLTDPKGRRLAQEASRRLLDFLRDKTACPFARAHVPAALSKLLGREGEPFSPQRRVQGGDLLHPGPWDEVRALRKEAVDLMKRYLKGHKENPMVLQSCALALGEMGNPADDSLVHFLDRISKGYLTRDQQTRYFADIALGRLGGAGSKKAVEYLALRLVKGGSKLDKPWVALGLGVSQAELFKRKQPATPGVGYALETAFREIRNPAFRGALAVALGLARHRTSGPLVQAVMDKTRDSDFKGYCALSLGLMKERNAARDLGEILKKSFLLPTLLRQTAVGLALMGEKSVVDTLLRTLRQGPRNLAAQSAVAMGLGLVGDRRAVPPLVDMLFNKKLPRTTRAFAAVALGMVGDKDPLPWNSRISFGLNYRANVETLWGGELGRQGLLDLW